MIDSSDKIEEKAGEVVHPEATWRMTGHFGTLPLATTHSLMRPTLMHESVYPSPNHQPAHSFRAPLLHFNSQLTSFHNLPHSSATREKSLLCFHILANTFSRSSFVLTSIRKHRGCTPPCTEKTDNSSPLNTVQAVLVDPEPRRAARSEDNVLLHSSMAGTNIAILFMNLGGQI